VQALLTLIRLLNLQRLRTKDTSKAGISSRKTISNILSKDIRNKATALPPEATTNQTRRWDTISSNNRTRHMAMDRRVAIMASSKVTTKIDAVVRDVSRQC
jgi:hypothetical protein